jgi:hypothetical protein
MICKFCALCHGNGLAVAVIDSLIDNAEGGLKAMRSSEQEYWRENGDANAGADEEARSGQFSVLLAGHAGKVPVSLGNEWDRITARFSEQGSKGIKSPESRRLTVGLA